MNTKNRLSPVGNVGANVVGVCVITPAANIKFNEHYNKPLITLYRKSK